MIIPQAMTGENCFSSWPTSLLELSQNYKSEAAIFRSKRDRALRRGICTEADFAMIRRLDGFDPLPYISSTDFRSSNVIVKTLVKSALALHVADKEREFYHVTLAPDRWATSITEPVIDFREMKAECRRHLSSLSPDFHGKFELQPVTNLYHTDGGRIIPVHAHAIVSGYDLQSAVNVLRTRYNARNKAAIPGGKAVVIDRIGPTPMDLARVTAYSFKALTREKTVYKNMSTGAYNLHESAAGDRFVHYLRLQQILAPTQLGAITFGGGVGSQMRRNAMRKGHIRLYDRVNQEPRQPYCDMVKVFFSDLFARLKLQRYAEPVLILS